MIEPSLLDNPENDPKLVLEAKIKQKEMELAWEALQPKAAYCRVEDWMADLPITPKQSLVLGRVWSFQIKDNGHGECYESVASIAEVCGDDKDNVKKHLRKMVGLGILVKTSRGVTKPASYRIDLVVCKKLIEQARATREANRADVSAMRRAQWNAKHEDETDRLL